MEPPFVPTPTNQFGPKVAAVVVDERNHYMWFLRVGLRVNMQGHTWRVTPEGSWTHEDCACGEDG